MPCYEIHVKPLIAYSSGPEDVYKRTELFPIIRKKNFRALLRTARFSLPLDLGTNGSGRSEALVYLTTIFQHLDLFLS